ncbi:MAG: hypothetical protein GKC05_07415 [Methanomicrobiales archaeon]|nr:hypothetical protein [Methanomicrobiales archaeon]NYT20771.1 hypothetical protein [Methanomicrobiales archaeon]
MGTRKSLTIGVTVNLEHYENLRIEVSGDVESAEDAGELAGFLDDILGRFGRGDPATAGLVDAYRRRVLPVREPAPGTPGHEGVGSGTPPEDTGGGFPLPGDAPAPAPAVRPPDAAPAPQAAGTDGAPACEVCGGTVTAAEQKMSRLFTSRTLCRACLKKL